jgi:hypothetical protein
LNPPWAASAIATTMPWPKRSTVSTRPRSSTGAAPGGAGTLSNTPRSNGWTSSTIAGFSSPLETSRPPRLKPPTMPARRNRLSPRDSNQLASGVPGAVHYLPRNLRHRAPKQFAVNHKNATQMCKKSHPRDLTSLDEARAGSTRSTSGGCGEKVKIAC